MRGALQPRDTPNDADGSGRGEVAEPVKRDGVGGENGEGQQEPGEQTAHGYFLGTDFVTTGDGPGDLEDRLVVGDGGPAVVIANGLGEDDGRHVAIDEPAHELREKFSRDRPSGAGK